MEIRTHPKLQEATGGGGSNRAESEDYSKMIDEFIGRLNGEVSTECQLLGRKLDKESELRQNYYAKVE